MKEITFFRKLQGTKIHGPKPYFGGGVVKKSHFFVKMSVRNENIFTSLMKTRPW